SPDEVGSPEPPVGTFARSPGASRAARAAGRVLSTENSALARRRETTDDPHLAPLPRPTPALARPADRGGAPGAGGRRGALAPFPPPLLCAPARDRLR